jgi:twitching motility protein PilT
MLAGTLKGIIGQRLTRTKDGSGRIAACEIMVATGRIKDFIMDPDQKTGQI